MVPKGTAVLKVWGHSWCPEPLAKAGAGEMVPLPAGGGCHQRKELQEEVSSCTVSEMILKKKKKKPDLLPCHVTTGTRVYSCTEGDAGRICIFYDWKIIIKPINLWLLALTEDDQCRGSRWEAGSYLKLHTEAQQHQESAARHLCGGEWRSQSGGLTCCQGLFVVGQSYGPEMWGECWAWSSPQVIDPAALPCVMGKTWGSRSYWWRMNSSYF